MWGTAFAIAAVLTAEQPNELPQPETYKNIGNWRVMRDPAFHGCSMYADFADGTEFRIGFDGREKKGNNAYMMVANRSWNIIPRQSYQMTFKFKNDGNGIFFGFGFDAEGLKGIVVRNLHHALPRLFKNDPQFRVVIGDKDMVGLNMQQTNKTVDALMECEWAMETEVPT